MPAVHMFDENSPTEHSAGRLHTQQRQPLLLFAPERPVAIASIVEGPTSTPLLGNSPSDATVFVHFITRLVGRGHCRTALGSCSIGLYLFSANSHQATAIFPSVMQQQVSYGFRRTACPLMACGVSEVSLWLTRAWPCSSLLAVFSC